MDKNIIKGISNLISDLTNELSSIFNISVDKAFIFATSLLSSPALPYFKNLDSESNKTISNYYNIFKKIEYKPSEMRRAYSESYLLSLRDKDNYTVDVTLELPLLYLKSISELLISRMNYTITHILNAYGNNGNLACLLSISDIINSDDIYVTTKSDTETSVATNLKKLVSFNYEITKELPPLSYRCDLIVSDPFLRKVEDILVFFADYTEYLNQNGFMVVILPTTFIRSRIFSDLINENSLVLLGIIEYPKDMLEGLIESSIVILEKKVGENKEFFSSEMPSIKDIDGNLKMINEIKKYLINYLGD